MPTQAHDDVTEAQQPTSLTATEPRKVRYAVYIRVSTDEQTNRRDSQNKIATDDR